MKHAMVVSFCLGVMALGCEGSGGDEAHMDVAVDGGEEDTGVVEDAGVDTAEEDVGEPVSTTACNGWDALCERSYSEVAYATTHNGMSSVEDGWLAANHYKGVDKQLAAGIRGLMLDAHPYLGESYLCHGECLAGNQLLSEGLSEIVVFLEAHPREVVTIIFESYITDAAMAEAFAESGLDAFVYAHPSPDAAWPTLGEMIEGGTRVVVLTDASDGSVAWYHDVWAHAFETHWSHATREDLSCAMNRGGAGNALFILNHFLSDPLPRPQLAEEINHNPFFEERVRECETAFGQIPNFVTVDFYTIGDVVEVVDALNGML